MWYHTKVEWTATRFLFFLVKLDCSPFVMNQCYSQIEKMQFPLIDIWYDWVLSMKLAVSMNSSTIECFILKKLAVLAILGASQGFCSYWPRQHDICQHLFVDSWHLKHCLLFKNLTFIKKLFRIIWNEIIFMSMSLLRLVLTPMVQYYIKH